VFGCNVHLVKIQTNLFLPFTYPPSYKPLLHELALTFRNAQYHTGLLLTKLIRNKGMYHLQVTIFWVVTLWRWSDMVLRNVGILPYHWRWRQYVLPKHWYPTISHRKASQTRRRRHEFSWPWKPQISHPVLFCFCFLLNIHWNVSYKIC